MTPRMTSAEYVTFLARSRRKDPALQACPDALVSESDLHDQILSDCRRRGWHAIHARMDKPTTSSVGDPDFVLLADGGRTFYIEAKSRSGKLTPAQAALQVQANKLGHTVHIVRTLEQYIAVITTNEK